MQTKSVCFMSSSATVGILLSAITVDNFSLRLQCVLQPLCSCLSSDNGLPTTSLCVSVLTSACGHRSLAQQLCSQHGKVPCLTSHHSWVTHPAEAHLSSDRQPVNLQVWLVLVFGLIAAVVSPADPCVFLKLFSFTRTRTDSQSTHRGWIQLDLQVAHSLSI